jgi:hypothetical protein
MARPINPGNLRTGRGASLSQIFCCGLALISALLSPILALAVERIDISGLTAVENSKLPEHWQPLIFPSIAAATSYEIVEDPVYGPVIFAESSSGAGGIARSISVDPEKYQVLNWSWKIETTLPGSSLVSKNGDDFPVRVMISFATNDAVLKGSRDNILCYVWASEESIDSIAVNPIHKHIMTVVAASGDTHSGTWLELSRNIVDDYRQAFSAKPGRITGVALMTDSDNTRSEARAWYGPVWLSSLSDPNPSPEIER